MKRLIKIGAIAVLLIAITLSIFIALSSGVNKSKPKEITYATIDNTKYIVVDSYVWEKLKSDIVGAKKEFQNKDILYVGKIEKIESHSMFDYKVTISHDGYKTNLNLYVPKEFEEKFKVGNTIKAKAYCNGAMTEGLQFNMTKLLSIE